MATKWTTYWWIINDEDSDLYGEEFFTELEEGTKEQHRAYAKEIFPNEKLTCYGQISTVAAEIMGYDTY